MNISQKRFTLLLFNIKSPIVLSPFIKAKLAHTKLFSQISSPVKSLNKIKLQSFNFQLSKIISSSFSTQCEFLNKLVNNL